MKEKRIDMYLSVASLLHLVVIGAGGTYFTEFFVDNSRSTVLDVALIGTLVGLLALATLYFKIAQTTKKKKWKS